MLAMILALMLNQVPPPTPATGGSPVLKPVTPAPVPAPVGHAYTVATTGKDTNPGTPAAPFATLIKAASVAKAGDTITVLPGAYGGFISGYDAPHPPLVGTATAPITFKGGPGVTLNNRNNKTSVGIDLMGCSWVIIDGFTLDGLTMPARPTKGIATDHCRHITVKNCTVVNFDSWGVYSTHSDDTTIQDSTIGGSRKQHGIYIANSCMRPTILRNTISNNPNCGLHLNGDGSQGPTVFDGVDNGAGFCIVGATIQDNVITGNGATGGAAINGDGLSSSVITGNRLLSNAAAGIALFHSDAGHGAINNTVQGNLVVMTPGAKYCLGIKNGSTGNTISGNVLVPGNNGQAIQMTADSILGTTFVDAASPRYSLDDGATSVDVTGFKAKLVPAAPVIPSPVNPVAAPASGVKTIKP